MPEPSPPEYQASPTEAKGYQNMVTPSSTPPDCAFEGMETNAAQKAVQSGKILPRINHGMKSGVAPYTVPNSQGQMTPMGPPCQGQAQGQTSQAFNFTDRPSCALSGNSATNSQETSNATPTPDEMQQSPFPKPMAAGPSGPTGSYYLDGNENMMRMDPMGGDYPHHQHPQSHPSSSHPHQMAQPNQTRSNATDFVPQPSNQQAAQGHYSMDHFSSMRQQQHPHPHHQQHPHPQQQPQEHPHMLPPHHQGDHQQQQHQQPQQFSSCSHANLNLNRPMSSDYRHMQHQQSTMQISSGAPNAAHAQQQTPSGYQMPLAMSTPMSNRPGSNPGPVPVGGSSSMGMPAPGYPHTHHPSQGMCPPGYDAATGVPNSTSANPANVAPFNNGQPGAPQEPMPSYNQAGPHGPHPGPHPHQHAHHPRGWGVGPHAPHSSGTEELQIQVPPMSPMKGGMPPQHQQHQPHPQQGLPHMQPSPTPACAASMGPSPHMPPQDPNSTMQHAMNAVPPHAHHQHPHPEYGPCVGMNCEACKMGPPAVRVGPHPHPHGSTPAGPPMSHQPHPHLGPCGGPSCHFCKIQQQQQPPPHPHHPAHAQHMNAKMYMPNQAPQPLPHAGPCAGPNCTACKLSHRPKMLSSQQHFLQHLVMGEASSAYRSHPLFPLLRDLVIAEANFDNPQFHYQQLLSTLPNDLQKLLQNFLHRNRPSGHYQSNQAVESVIMDGLRLAHSNLVGEL